MPTHSVGCEASDERDGFTHALSRGEHRADESPRKAPREVIDRDKLDIKPFPGYDVLLQSPVGPDKEKLRPLFEERLADGDSWVDVAAGPSACNQHFHDPPLPADLEMLRSTPIAAKLTTREVLPKLTKGRVMPVTGKEPVATPMFNIA